MTESPKIEQAKEALLKAKEELNFLYRTPPFETSGGVDYGWFCREHAYHIFHLLKILKVNSNFANGHVYFLLDDAGRGIDTSPTDSDHWWIWCDEIGPIDFSITPNHLSEGHIDHIWEKPSPVNPFLYTKNKKEYAQFIGQKGIAYLELNLNTPDPLAIVDDPYIVLNTPGDGGIKQSIHTEVFSAITVHLWKLMNGQTMRLSGRIGHWAEAMKVIVKQNPYSDGRLKKLLND